MHIPLSRKRCTVKQQLSQKVIAKGVYGPPSMTHTDTHIHTRIQTPIDTKIRLRRRTVRLVMLVVRSV